jgi:phenylacetate-CoA ligase
MPIVTDLWRTTQPIIRYRLNDILQLDPQPCPCGSTFRVIKAIEGRSDDVCYFTTYAGVPRAFYADTIRRMILLASADITDYQATQEAHGHLHIALEVKASASFASIVESVQQSVQQTLALYDCQPASVEISAGVDALAPGMKRRRVRNLVRER